MTKIGVTVLGALRKKQSVFFIFNICLEKSNVDIHEPLHLKNYSDTKQPAKDFQSASREKKPKIDFSFSLLLPLFGLVPHRVSL